MTQVQSETTELQSQYAAQLTADLERNTKEQERIAAEVVALQELLQALRRDQALLVNLRRTLGDETPAAAGAKAAEPAATVPSVPRQASAEPKSAPKPAKQQKKAAAAKPAKAARTTPRSAGTKAAAKAPEAAGKPTLTLVELIHDHLSRQSEPRSAAEITSTLSETHPERGIKATVVRTTVEGLVAKGRAQRSKQGTSVYYTAAGTGTADDSAKQAAPEQKAPVTD
ncbi:MULTISPECIES: hypothetical protein [unclassified Streptomyces]|uniref:hypothetical protein n=1 Tax=unclassified Streptomyces TaxID=2593676 RepID=UPI0033A7E949|nr:hypothetical protein OG199_00555 [Streptomyces sp. NBC_01176]WSS89311.1 hypothetical protein OG199_43080 [Streptomyces sp. NBC_01176]